MTDEKTPSPPRIQSNSTPFLEPELIRKQAEQKAKDMHSPDLDTMTREEIRQMVHELNVKQLEAGLQNEQLRSQFEERDSEASLYRIVTDNMLDMVALTDMEGNFTFAGKSHEILGYEPGFLIGKNVMDFVHPEHLPCLLDEFNRLLSSGSPRTVEYRFRCKDQSYIWLEMIGKVVSDENGNPWKIVISARDITAHKSREDERHELITHLLKLISTPGNFREIISSLLVSLQSLAGSEAVGIRMLEGEDFPYYETRGFPPKFIEAENYLCAYGPDGKILRNDQGNPVLECMCGNILSGSFDPSKPFFTNHGSFWTHSTSALLASTTEADRQARTRNRCHGEGYESVALIPIRSGNMVFGLLQFNDHRPGRFNIKQITFFESVADNLAIGLAQRKAEEALRRSENYYRAIFETSGAAMFISEDDTTISLVNSNFVELSGYSRQEIEGKKSWTEFVHPDDVAWMKENHYLRRQNPDAAPRRYEFRLITRNEEMRHILLGVDRIPESDQNIASCIDITERKQAEAEKEAIEVQTRQLHKAESLGRMAGAIAHNFNNQLQAVMGNIEIVMDDLQRDKGVLITLAEAMNAAHQASEISRLMLTYLGQTTGSHEPLDLSEACWKSLTLLRAGAPKGMFVKAEISSSGPVILSNDSHIQQILTNLITNAWEAGVEEKGAVRLIVKTVSGGDISSKNRFPVDWQPHHTLYACLEVIDEGQGIAEQDIEKVFDPFFTKKLTGRGLGLSVVMGIVKAHGGGVTVESEPGRGSTFRVFLPVSAEQVTCSPARPETPNTVKTEKIPGRIAGSTLLVVEDDEQVRKLAKNMLEFMGYTVLVAKDGLEAVEIFNQHQHEISCVLSDLTMPNMDGWETLAALRKLSPDIPVILSSGYDEAQVMAEEHTERPDAFIGKPYQRKDLGDTIERVLREKS